MPKKWSGHTQKNGTGKKNQDSQWELAQQAPAEYPIQLTI